MKINHPSVGVVVFLFSLGIHSAMAQSSGPEFLDCNTSPLSLCTSDEGISLPANNKFFLGEENPNATSCSVHVSQKTRVHSTCGKHLQYEVQLFLADDTSTSIILQPQTSILTDSSFEAELSFDSELSPENSIHENGIPYTIGCGNYHRIRWIVSDSCDQITTCEKLLELYDCTSPFLADTGLLYIVKSSIAGLVWLRLDSLIDTASDDCAKKTELIYSLYPDHYKSDSMFIICDVPALGVELPLDIWIGDEGHDLNCDGNIDWSERNIKGQQIKIVYVDNFGGCEPGDPYLEGTIQTQFHQGIKNAFVTFQQEGHIYPAFVTNENGDYLFYYIEGPDITVNVEKNDNHRNGVSTLDLVRIQKHLLGIDTLNSPYDVIAADANNSQYVSAIDLIEIRKLILGIYTEFPHNHSWRFVPKNFIFQDTMSPWPYVESNIIEANGQNAFLDFIGIKIGDVNGTAQPNAQGVLNRGSLQEIKWYVDQKKFSSNDIIDINFYFDDWKKIQGFQFTIADPDLEFLGATSERINLGAEDFALFDDKMTFAWFDENGVDFSNSEIVFTVRARAKSKGDLKNNLTINSDITQSEIYWMDDAVSIPILRVIDKNNNSFQSIAEPNPWKEKTTIPFHLNETGNVFIQILDLDGKSIYLKRGQFDAGDNQIIIQSSDFSSRGLLYYFIKSNEFVSTNKMIVFD